MWCWDVNTAQNKRTKAYLADQPTQHYPLTSFWTQPAGDRSRKAHFLAPTRRTAARRTGRVGQMGLQNTQGHDRAETGGAHPPPPRKPRWPRLAMLTFRTASATDRKKERRGRGGTPVHCTAVNSTQEPERNKSASMAGAARLRTPYPNTHTHTHRVPPCSGAGGTRTGTRASRG